MKKLISISLLAFIAALFIIAATPDAVFDGDVSLTSITNAAAITIESTGAGVNINLHSDAGDDFAVDTDKLVVEGDTGNVGIGDSTPSYALEILRASGTTQSNIVCTVLADGEVASWRSEGQKLGGTAAFSSIGTRYNSASTSKQACGYIFLDAGDEGNNYFWVDDSDLFRISTDTSHVGSTNGTVVGDQTSSDERLKNIHDGFEYGLDEIMELDPIVYDMKSDSKHVKQLGFSAQATRIILPEVVYDTKEFVEDESGENIVVQEEKKNKKGEEIQSRIVKKGKKNKLVMCYRAIIPVLVKAMQEQQAQIEALKSRIEQLENKE